MHTISAKLTLYIPHAASLKDKRQVGDSLIVKTRQKYNASVTEVDTQDFRQTLTIGIAVVSGDYLHARRSVDEVIRFIDEQAERVSTEVVKVETDE